MFSVTYSAVTLTLLCLTIGHVFVGVHSVAFELFYPFGEPEGDTFLDAGDDTSSDEINLNEPIVLYNTSYRKVYVNTNGHLTFDTDLPGYLADRQLPFGVPMVAIFLADVDITGKGNILYRSTTNPALIGRAAADVQTYFSGFERYTPTSLFIVTWYQVGYYRGQSDKTNTFQLVIATDGRDSFAFLHYLQNGIEWTKGQGKYQPRYDDVPPQAGFDGGRGSNSYTLPGSGDTAAFLMGSNVNLPGLWMYHIGNTRDGNVRPADQNTGEVIVFNVDNQEQGCFQTVGSCHEHAQCIEFEKGACCVCVPPFYGNGLGCLSKGAPQRVNGRVSGTVNGVSLEGSRLHSYVVTNDGRAYTAISGVSPSFGSSFGTLTSIGGIFGWLFAVQLGPRAKNGYTLTGAKFNRTARVTFQRADGADYVLRIFQEFYGHENPDHIRVDTRLEGRIPLIPANSEITVDDYRENFKRVAPGTIKSFVSRHYHVNGQTSRYSWENTITFDECDRGNGDENGLYPVHVSRHFIKYNETEQVIRFVMSSQVGYTHGFDPCSNGTFTCGANSECVSEGGSFKCACKFGYLSNGVECEDIDECEQLSPCHINARCINRPGNFECRCEAGYVGDGRTCTARVQMCGQNICDSNARCVADERTRQPKCICNAGFHGNGVSCSTDSCNEADICGDNARCVYDEELKNHVCECLDEFSGDGYSCQPYLDSGCQGCHRFAQCLYDQDRRIQRCQCNEGYTGNGKECTLIDTCENCHPHYAKCAFSFETSDYECQCLRGYRGDGRTCTRRDCREDVGMCDPVGGLCWLDQRTNVSICRCNHGYRGDGFNCTPVGCDVQKNCHRDAECIFDGRNHMCKCNDGFVGDGRRCSPQATDCSVVKDCHPDARCVFDDGYTCRCNTGYEGDGKSCRRINLVVPCNEINNCDRFAECIQDPDNPEAFKCSCLRGYVGDGLTCRRREVRDCRSDRRICSSDAECVQGSDEAYVCVCKSGYRGDGAVCSPALREGNYLIYAQGQTVMRVSADVKPRDYGQQLVNIKGMLAVGIDTDCQDGLLYWTDAAHGLIRRSQLNGSNIEVIVSGLKSPEGIAVDHSARNLFFTDSELDKVLVSRLDGTNMKTLVSTDMVNPRAIVLDLSRGVLYWTDWNRSKPQIERMNMDGTNRKVLVREDLQLPNGLSFDSYSQTLCWGDAGTQSIECIRSDGVGRRVVNSKAPYPFDLTVLNNVIYWSDWQRKDIPNIDQRGGEPNQPLRLAFGGNGRVYGITAVRDKCTPARNVCASNNGCRYLCLASESRSRTCACPDGVDPRLCEQ